MSRRTGMNETTARRTHRLKTLPRYFRAMKTGDKTFEVRRDDRAYAEGDLLVLRLYDPSVCDCGSLCSKQPDDELRRVVTYVLPGGRFGIDPGYVVLGLADLEGGS